MGTRSLNERIAKAMGWGYAGDTGEWGYLPNWAEDLNLMNDLVNALDAKDIWLYHVNLLLIVSKAQNIFDPRRLTIEELKAFMEPTATQKAEAWLNVKELQEVEHDANQ